MTADESYRLIERIDADRLFMLLAYQSNPELLARADEQVQRLFPSTGDEDRRPASADFSCP